MYPNRDHAEEALMFKIAIAAGLVLFAGALMATKGAPTDTLPSPQAVAHPVALPGNSRQISYTDAHINAHLEGLPVHFVEDFSLVYPVTNPN